MFRRIPKQLRSKQRPTRSFEALERRELMAADFAAGVSDQLIDQVGNGAVPVSVVAAPFDLSIASSDRLMPSSFTVQGRATIGFATLDGAQQAMGPQIQANGDSPIGNEASGDTTNGTLVHPIAVSTSIPQFRAWPETDSPASGVTGMTQSMTGRVWTVTGTDLADRVEVNNVGDQVMMTLTAANGTVNRFSYSKSAVDRIEFHGLAGGDVFLNDSDVPSWAYGDAGLDYLKGGNGENFLSGGEGDDILVGGVLGDGLVGGAGADQLYGNAGADRFLTQAGDTANDVALEDAVIDFTDSSTAAWKDLDIEVVDRAFRIMQGRTGNTHLLKDPVTSVPITFQRVAIIPGAAADNTDPTQPYAISDFWSQDDINDRTPHRLIRITDNAFTSEDWAKEVVLHEIGHNWDSSKEIGRVLPGLGGLWNVFDDIHSKALKVGPNAFVNHPTASGVMHGQTDVQEDFADTFAHRLLGKTYTDPYILGRYDLMDEIFGTLGAKGQWDGHADDFQELPSEWKQFTDWLDARRDDLVSFFAKLDPSQLKLAMPQFTGQMFASIVPTLYPSKLRELLPTLDGDMFTGVVNNMSPSQLENVLGQVSGSTLRDALNSLTNARIGNVLEMFSGDALKSMLEQMPAGRIANVLRGVNGDTLRASLNCMRDNLTADVLEQLDGGTLDASLGQMSAERIAEVIKGVNGDTLKTSLTRMGDKLTAKVLELVDRVTLKAAIDRLSSSRVAAVLRHVNGDTLKTALAKLTDVKGAQVLEAFDGVTLEAALERMTSDRIANVLAHVDGSTLKASLRRMSDKLSSAVFEKFDGATLKAALARMTDSSVAAILNRVDVDTLKAALKRLDVDRVKVVVSRLDKDVAESAKEYLKKLDPKKFADVVGSVAKKSDPRNWRF